MAKKRQESEWGEAKRRCRLDTETLRMAKELGLNPRNLIKNIPSKSQPWKAPVAVWIRELYRKRSEKAAPRQAERAAPSAENNQPPGSAGAESDPDPISLLTSDRSLQPRGTRYEATSRSTDGRQAAVICRIKATGDLLFITTYLLR
jgi:hypothetical protein